MKVKKIKNAISLNGEIDKNYYQFTPGVRITLEAGTTFKGIDVGGQILYNDERVVSTFTFDLALVFGTVKLIKLKGKQNAKTNKVYIRI